MRIGWWTQLIKLSLLLNVIALLGDSSSSTTTTAIKSSLDGGGDSRNSSSSGGTTIRQKYHLKFITPYTQYPFRLKDHYASKKGTTTRWFKHGCQCFVDEIALGTKYYSTEKDQYDTGAETTHLLLMSYDVKSHFVLDNYQPKHQEEKAKNSDVLYDYEYSFENDIDREIYTLVYLTNFELSQSHSNFTLVAKEIEPVSDQEAQKQAYSDISCRVSLLLPNGLSDEHSAILNERLENSLHLHLKLFDGSNSDDLADIGRSSGNRRNVKFKSIGGTSMKQRMKRSKSSSKHAEFYEMEIVEGPMRVFKDNFRASGLNASCALSLKDFDHTFAFNSFINDTVFASSSDAAASFSSATSDASSPLRSLPRLYFKTLSSSSFLLHLTLFLFVAVSKNFLFV